MFLTQAQSLGADRTVGSLPIGGSERIFLELVFVAGDFEGPSRDELEDTLEEALQLAGIGEVVGGGAGEEKFNIDIEVDDLATSLPVIRNVLLGFGVQTNTRVFERSESSSVEHALYYAKIDQNHRISSLRIVFAENHETFARAATEEFLPGHQVDIIPTINAADAALRSSSYDLLLVDFDLDDGKGDELVRLARNRDPSFLIVAVSAREEGNDALVRAGANAACSKLNFALLPEIIAKLWSGRGAG